MNRYILIFLEDRRAFEHAKESGVFMEISLSPKYKGTESQRDAHRR